MKRPKILFFTKKALVSEEEELQARAYLAAEVLFRFSQFAKNESSVEKCDAVMGDIPENYSHFPKASELFEVVEIKPLTQKQIEKNEPVKTAQKVSWVGGK